MTSRQTDASNADRRRRSAGAHSRSVQLRLRRRWRRELEPAPTSSNGRALTGCRRAAVPSRCARRADHGDRRRRGENSAGVQFGEARSTSRTTSQVVLDRSVTRSLLSLQPSAVDDCRRAREIGVDRLVAARRSDADPTALVAGASVRSLIGRAPDRRRAGACSSTRNRRVRLDRVGPLRRRSPSAFARHRLAKRTNAELATRSPSIERVDTRLLDRGDRSGRGTGHLVRARGGMAHDIGTRPTRVDREGFVIATFRRRHRCVRARRVTRRRNSIAGASAEDRLSSTSRRPGAADQISSADVGNADGAGIAGDDRSRSACRPAMRPARDGARSARLARDAASDGHDDRNMTLERPIAEIQSVRSRPPRW